MLVEEVLGQVQKAARPPESLNGVRGMSRRVQRAAQPPESSACRETASMDGDAVAAGQVQKAAQLPESSACREIAPFEGDAVVSGQVQKAAQLPGRTGGVMIFRKQVQNAAQPLTGQRYLKVSCEGEMR